MENKSIEGRPEVAGGAGRPGGGGFSGPGGGGPTVREIEVAGSLRTVIHRLVKLLRRETKNEAQLSLTERAALGLLYNQGELLPSDIAKAEKVTTQSISQVINRLVELKYIVKKSSTEDKRKVLLSLTPEGRGYVEQLRQDKTEWLSKVLHEKASAEEMDVLMQAIKILGRLMNDEEVTSF
ncbi:MAG: MarR family transcriptional regulator [Bacteroidetes bacterium]|nr:MarR family transcriptional regulator [Bacteroidota bacterium]